MPQMKPRLLTVPFDCAHVGFALRLGELQPAKDVKTSGGVGSERAFIETETVSCDQMKSLSVATNGNVVAAVWKGHPLCGDGFTVTAKMTLRPDGGFEYSSFDYSGNDSGLYVNRIVFPEVSVPLTDKTALFRPRKAGDVWRPDWSTKKPGQVVYASGQLFKAFNCMAALEEGGASHFLDQRGDDDRKGECPEKLHHTEIIPQRAKEGQVLDIPPILWGVAWDWKVV